MNNTEYPQPIAALVWKAVDRLPAVKSIMKSALRQLGYEVRRLPPPGGAEEPSSPPLKGEEERRYDRWPSGRLRHIVIGTTSVCNASCVHCPTNKEMTKHLPKKFMPWEIFEKSIRGIRDTGLPIDGIISFGLFAESLLDPLIVKRAAFTKEMLPHVTLNLNSNGAPLTEELARALGKYVDVFSIHIESVDARVYHELMFPLRAENVFPKVEMLIRECGRPVNISFPVHKKNVHELEAIRAYWLSRGASNIYPLPFYNRCTDSLRFRELAVGSPTPTQCRQELASDLIIDWDGAVLACCDDFLKRKVIGDIRVESVRETLASPARKNLFEEMRDGRWADVVGCKDCFYDKAPPLT
jgi:radical SAM protein with 4Fe4S-binding SPASM domain